MKYFYSVVRFVPDSFRGEFVNVGVIVGSADTYEWRVRRVSNSTRAKRLGADTSVSAVWVYLDEVESMISALSDDVYEANLAVPLLDRGWLDLEHRRQKNLVQLSQPAAVIADDVDEAVRKVFDTFVLDPDRQQRATRSRAITTLRKAYLESLDGRFVHERVQGRIGRQRLDIDFAVGNGSLAQLSHAWSFRAQNTRPTVEKIKAWSWTLRDIRDNGGEIRVPGRGQPYTLSPDVPVDIIYDEPETEQGRQDLGESLEVFERLRVTAFSTVDVNMVVADARESLEQRLGLPMIFGARALGNPMVNNSQTLPQGEVDSTDSDE